MLYLAEYKRKRQGIIGSTCELTLLAYQNGMHSWSILSEEKTILLKQAYSFSDETLVTANIVNNEAIRNIEAAKPCVINILRDLTKVIDEQQQQKENIEQWKQSLEYQFEELELQKKQIELREKRLQERKRQLLSFETENLNNNFAHVEQMISSKKLLGEILQEANLVSDVQLELALTIQKSYPEIKLGKILALKGWIKPNTVDFFNCSWSYLLNQKEKHPLGFYLKQSSILDENQIKIILDEQKKLKLKLGEIAVLKGWLNVKTLNYFLENIYSEIDKKLAA